MNCRNCGKENEEGVKVCQFCAEPIELNSDQVLIEIDEQSIKNLPNQGSDASILKRYSGGDERTFLLVSGCFLLLVGIFVVSTYFALRSLLDSFSGWAEDLFTSFDSTQVIGTPLIEETDVPNNTQIINYSEIYGESEILYYAVLADVPYNRPFQSIARLELVGMEKQIIAEYSEGFTPVFSIPESGQSFISPDRKTIALFAEDEAGGLLLFRRGESEPFLRDQSGYI